jgi:peptide/nickel transport system substrate-binding protein
VGNGFTTKLYYRDVVRGYLPDPKVVAADIQAQLKANLNIDVVIEEQESGTFLDNADAGTLDGLHLLGWGADYPDVTNFLDYHFGAGSSDQFGNRWDDITSALTEGAGGADDAAREPAYTRANNAIKQHVPMIPVAHGGSGVAYRADVEGGFASPLGNEYFAVMNPGGRTQFVWMQNAEPPGLYCADETDGEALRVCEQMMEPLYGYEIGGTAAEPLLAESCEPSADLATWTCVLREGVTFHDGATLDANDVVMSYAVQWDADHPLHKGRDGSFTYFSGLFGGLLNPPPATE